MEWKGSNRETTNGDDSSSPGFLHRGREKRQWPYCTALVFLIVFHVAVSVIYLQNEDLPPQHDPAGHLLRSVSFMEQVHGARGYDLGDFLRTSNYYPPLYYWVSIPFQSLFGPSKDAGTYSIQVFFAIALLGTYAVGRRLFSPGVGLLSATLLSLYPMVFGISRIFYPDLPLLALTVAGFYALLRSECFTNRKWTLLFGAVSGLAFLVKWTYPIFLAGPMAYALWMGLGRIDLSAGIGRFLRKREGKAAFLWYLGALAFAAFFSAVLLRIAQVGGRPLSSMPLIGAALFHLALGAGLCASQALRKGKRSFEVLPRPAKAGSSRTVAWNLALAAAVALVIAGPWYWANLGPVLYRLRIAATTDAEARRMPGVFLPESLVLYLFYLEGHQLHLLFFALAAVAVVYHLLRRKSEGALLVVGSFLVAYVLLCGIRLKDPRFSLPFLPYLALASGAFLSRFSGKALIRGMLIGAVLLFGFYQLTAITFGDGVLPEWLRIPEKVIRMPRHDAEIALFKKYGYGTSNNTDQNWRHDLICRRLLDRWPKEKGRKALVRVVGNHHYLHHGSLELTARCEGNDLRFVPGLTTDLNTTFGVAAVLDADFILIKVGKNPGPDFSVPNYEFAVESLAAEGGFLEGWYQEVLRNYLPDDDEVVAYKKRPVAMTPLEGRIDWGEVRAENLRISSTQWRPDQPALLRMDLYLTPEAAKTYALFVHLIAPNAEDLGDFIHPAHTLLSRFDGDLDQTACLQGPITADYVLMKPPAFEDLEPGVYRLGFGVWDPGNGERLEATTPHGEIEPIVVLEDSVRFSRERSDAEAQSGGDEDGPVNVNSDESSKN